MQKYCFKYCRVLKAKTGVHGVFRLFIFLFREHELRFFRLFQNSVLQGSEQQNGVSGFFRCDLFCKILSGMEN